MHQILIRKLEQFVRLNPEARDALMAVACGKPRHVSARRKLVANAGADAGSLIVLHGWICPYKHLADGRWQILSFFLPGDVCEYGDYIDRDGEVGLQAMSDCIVLDLPPEALDRVIAAHPTLARARRAVRLAQAASLQEWVISLGKRTARERCAHLICELFWRLRAMDHARDGTIDFPLTQEEIGCTIGVSTVHANRVLQDLRNDGFIEQSGKRLKMLDPKGLERVALFDPEFLRFDTNLAPAIVGRAPLPRAVDAVRVPNPGPTHSIAGAWRRLREDAR